MVTRDLLEHPVEAVGADAVAEAPLVVAAAPPTPPIAPPTPALSPEIGVAPQSGSPILDLLQATGWTVSKTSR